MLFTVTCYALHDKYDSSFNPSLVSAVFVGGFCCCNKPSQIFILKYCNHVFFRNWETLCRVKYDPEVPLTFLLIFHAWQLSNYVSSRWLEFLFFLFLILWYNQSILLRSSLQSQNHLYKEHKRSLNKRMFAAFLVNKL